LWTRKHQPFLICKCKKGGGVLNTNHKCSIINHMEHLRLYSLSHDKWEIDKNNTTTKEHMDWVDEKNNGISHFGLSPLLLPLHSIRFDIFHLRSAITRSLLKSLRTFMRAQVYDAQTDFDALLLMKIWDTHYVNVWKLNKPFSSLKGKQILSFIKNIPSVVEFINTTFENTLFLTNLKHCLTLWEKLSQFIHITTVSDRGKYELEIVEFNCNLKLFYKHGSKSFLSQKVVGDRETFYTHTLRFYLPTIVDDTWENIA
jgi:hypothetical protein